MTNASGTSPMRKWTAAALAAVAANISPGTRILLRMPLLLTSDAPVASTPWEKNVEINSTPESK